MTLSSGPQSHRDPGARRTEEECGLRGSPRQPTTSTCTLGCPSLSMKERPQRSKSSQRMRSDRGKPPQSLPNVKMPLSLLFSNNNFNMETSPQGPDNDNWQCRTQRLHTSTRAATRVQTSHGTQNYRGLLTNTCMHTHMLRCTFMSSHQRT